MEKNNLQPKSAWIVMGFWIVILLTIIWLINIFNPILFPFVVSMIFAYLLNPMINWLQTKGTNRFASILIVMGSFFLIVIGLLLWVIPALIIQITEFIAEFPSVAQNLNDKIIALVEGIQNKLPFIEAASEQSIQERIQVWLTEHSKEIWVVGQNIVTKLFGTGARIIGFLSLIFLTPVITVYLLMDWDKFVAAIQHNIPRDYISYAAEIFTEMNNVLSGFLRGQLLVCTILAIWYSISLSVVGLPYGVLIGILIGFFAFIPYLGTWLGVLLGLGTAVAQFDNIFKVIAVGIVLIIGQLVESNYLSPKLVGDRVSLHPVWTIFALFAGGTIAGFTGVLLAVPVAACVGVLVRFAMARYRESGFYLGFNKNG